MMRAGLCLLGDNRVVLNRGLWREARGLGGIGVIVLVLVLIILVIFLVVIVVAIITLLVVLSVVVYVTHFNSIRFIRLQCQSQVSIVLRLFRKNINIRVRVLWTICDGGSGKLSTNLAVWPGAMRRGNLGPLGDWTAGLLRGIGFGFEHSPDSAIVTVWPRARWSSDFDPRGEWKSKLGLGPDISVGNIEVQFRATTGSDLKLLTDWNAWLGLLIKFDIGRGLDGALTVLEEVLSCGPASWSILHLNILLGIQIDILAESRLLAASADSWTEGSRLAFWGDRKSVV